MRLVVFGLSVSSSWGNGHATLWRGLIRALAASGHTVIFFERDVPYYAEHRDLHALPGGSELLLYPDWAAIRDRAVSEIARADAAMVTSYCPDGAAASDLVQQHAPGVTVFYDLDTPVTLARLAAGQPVPYLPTHGLSQFDLVLSYTGGAALGALTTRLGAQRVAPLYGHVDPQQHRPAPARDAFRGDLSYLGTYAKDRQPALDALFLQPARLRPALRFVLGGAGYPPDFGWIDNVWFVQHLPPSEHPSFFCSSRLTLNVTRADMAAMGYCPSGRIFEAAACGVPLITDWWEGLDAFFEPGTEILVAQRTEDVLDALERASGDLVRLASAARARVLGEHSSEHRAAELLRLLRDPDTVRTGPGNSVGATLGA